MWVSDYADKVSAVKMQMHIQNVPRQNVPRQNVPRQNVPRQNIPGTKRPGTKRPKGQNVPVTKRPKGTNEAHDLICLANYIIHNPIGSR